MDIASPMLPLTDDHSDLSVYELDNTALTALVKFQKENNPRLKGKSNRDIADACGMSENTFCAILKGKNRNPRVGTLVCILRAIGGGSIDRLVGLAPHRDFAKEEAVFDATLVDSLQARLDEKRERIRELTNELGASEEECNRLRKMYNQKCIELSKAEARIESLNNRESEQVAGRAELVRMRRLANTLLAILIALVSVIAVLYIIWEIRHPDLGLTGLINDLLA